MKSQSWFVQGGGQPVGDLSVGRGQTLGQSLWQVQTEGEGMLTRRQNCGRLLVLMADQVPGVLDMRSGCVACCGRVGVVCSEITVGEIDQCGVSGQLCSF